VYWSLIALDRARRDPLNAFAFRLFHEPDLLTYAMTVTVAVGLVAFAHAVGLFLSRPERTGIERVLVGVFVALPVAAIAVISLVRFGYLVDVGGDNDIGPVIGTLAFGLINLLVFGAAAGLSYLHHDPRTLVNRRAAIRAAERDRSRAEHRLDEQERKRSERERERKRGGLELQAERHRAELEARKREALLHREQIADAMRLLREAASERVERLTELYERVHAARAALGEAQRAVEALGAERRALWEATSTELAQIRASRDRLVFAYCSANVRARAGHAAPECLRSVPPLELPPEFENGAAEAVCASSSRQALAVARAGLGEASPGHVTVRRSNNTRTESIRAPGRVGWSSTCATALGADVERTVGTASSDQRNVSTYHH
jgi:hypothetical protein